MCAFRGSVSIYLVGPVFSFAFDPHSLPFDASGLSVGAGTVLFSIRPLAFVLAPVLPGVDAKAMFAVIVILAVVLSAVLPGVNATSMHVIFTPRAVILAAIGPLVKPRAVDFVLIPLSVVHGAVVPHIATLTVLHAFFVAAFILRAI